MYMDIRKGCVVQASVEVFWEYSGMVKSRICMNTATDQSLGASFGFPCFRSAGLCRTARARLAVFQVSNLVSRDDDLFPLGPRHQY